MERYLESKHLTPIPAHCHGADLATGEGGEKKQDFFSAPSSQSL